MSGKAGSRRSNAIIRKPSFSTSGLCALCAGFMLRQAVPRLWEEVGRWLSAPATVVLYLPSMTYPTDTVPFANYPEARVLGLKVIGPSWSHVTISNQSQENSAFLLPRPGSCAQPWSWAWGGLHLSCGG